MSSSFLGNAVPVMNEHLTCRGKQKPDSELAYQAHELVTRHSEVGTHSWAGFFALGSV
jgi:hypothetical protein